MYSYEFPNATLFRTRVVILAEKKRGFEYGFKTDGLSRFCLKLENKTTLDPNAIGM